MCTLTVCDSVWHGKKKRDVCSISRWMLRYCEKTTWIFWRTLSCHLEKTIKEIMTLHILSVSILSSLDPLLNKPEPSINFSSLMLLFCSSTTPSLIPRCSSPVEIPQQRVLPQPPSPHAAYRPPSLVWPQDRWNGFVLSSLLFCHFFPCYVVFFSVHTMVHSSTVQWMERNFVNHKVNKLLTAMEKRDVPKWGLASFPPHHNSHSVICNLQLRSKLAASQ